eukprot:Colp12_sorted_trinity150504_noHs@26665
MSRKTERSAPTISSTLTPERKIWYVGTAVTPHVVASSYIFYIKMSDLKCTLEHIHTYLRFIYVKLYEFCKRKLRSKILSYWSHALTRKAPMCKPLTYHQLSARDGGVKLL